MSAASEYAGLGEIPADLFKVVKGSPSEAELAALVAGILATRAALAPTAGAEEASEVPQWRDYGRRLGAPARPSKSAWRWSGR